MATVTQPTTARNEFFKQIKPLCVPLSQLALRATDKVGSAKEIIGLVENLTSAWESQGAKDPSALDEKLAEYVFFPLSHILRSQDQYPVRVSEAIIRLLRALIRYGWKAKISKELSQQLLIFFTFLVGGLPGQEAERRELPEETVVEAYKALEALITAAGTAIAAPPPSSQESINPALGYSLTVVFDGITVATDPNAQLEGLEYVRAVFTAIKDDLVLATFLPGTVSALGKLLSTPQQRTQRRVLIKGLDVLKTVLVAVLDDFKTLRLVKGLEVAKRGTSKEPEQEVQLGEVLTPSWLKATASQVKIALSTVLKLRNHEAEDVQEALYRFCVALLNDCHASLPDCQSMLVESAMIVESEEVSQSTVETGLHELANVYPELGNSVKSIMYSWITGLPRLMQSSEERPKQLAIRKIVNGNKLITTLKVDSSTLEDAMGSALRDSLATLILNSQPPKVLDEISSEASYWTNTALAESGSDSRLYQAVLVGGEGQRVTMAELNSLINRIGSASQQIRLATEMLEFVRDSEGVEQIAAYWLSFELIKAAKKQSTDVGDFLDASAFEEGDEESMAFEELYQFSSSVVAFHSDTAEADWRLEAIALEVVAFAASESKTEFRGELIDVLYPIATFLGSQNPRLRQHAIVTLNNIAVSTGYASVSELIIDNVDYMVNSVSLKLNTFDISPASTKVLKMMIRLTGPKLIPFLDDVVVAIFTALDNYHGYPSFVEGLFAVLSEVVEQGVRSDQLLLEGTDTKAVDHKKTPSGAPNMASILKLLDERTERARQRKAEEEEEANVIVKGHVKAPWGNQEKGKTSKSFIESLEEGLGDEDEDDPPPAEVEKPKPSNTPTYALLSRITTLTQHYLTSPTPTLRKSLLDLVVTVSPALAPDESAFLPLVNDVWPVIISRLRDPEPYVVISACKALASLCAAAGDFLASRFKTEWAETLGSWCRRRFDEASKATAHAGGKRGGGAGDYPGGSGLGDNGKGIVLPIRSASGELTRSVTSTMQPASSALGGLGKFAQAVQIWEAVVGLLTAVVAHVRIDDDVFDQILDLLGDLIPRHEAVRQAMEVVNADAVWLALYRRGMVEWRPEPEMDGVVFAQMDLVRSRSWYGSGQFAVPIESL
ncbi:hypothetical protein GQ53DRAFT_765634 [Thozetella sp. PMI_491]|nr:hypothetical protein GQ53DRAFT_765634 [Thozetella sp. PMI_491]